VDGENGDDVRIESVEIVGKNAGTLFVLLLLFPDFDKWFAVMSGLGEITDSFADAGNTVKAQYLFELTQGGVAFAFVVNKYRQGGEGMPVFSGYIGEKPAMKDGVSPELQIQIVLWLFLFH